MIVLSIIIVSLVIALFFVKLVEKVVNEKNVKVLKLHNSRKKYGKRERCYYIINEEEEVKLTPKNEMIESGDKKGGENLMKNDKIVRVKDYIPDIEVELKYATKDNFTHNVIYNFDDAYLRYGTVVKLKAVHENIKSKGFRLKIWDAFRPVAAQFKLWEVYPDDTFVANPLTGYSDHSRGNTVDVTLVEMDGKYVKMPSDFDDFSEKAKRNYQGGLEEERRNNLILEEEMKKQGFIPYINEWWHYSDQDEYPVEKEFEIR